MSLKLVRLVSLFSVTCLALASASHVDAADARPFQLVVMDPLAAPLSCPCVEGYAQRKYETLGKHLEAALGRKVEVTFAEALAKALKDTNGHVDLIVGKDSVVRADATAAKIKVSAVAALADKKGETMQHGLIVVRKDDPATSAKDLKGYDIIFGPRECDEKHAAAIALLKDAGVAIPKTLTIDEACSDGACKVIELGSKKRVAAVISSYAAPLLEGCGTIKKGDLRVVGKTKEVPFIRAFTNNRLPSSDQDAVERALLNLVEAPEVCEKLESLVGFVEIAKKK